VGLGEGVELARGREASAGGFHGLGEFPRPASFHISEALFRLREAGCLEDAGHFTGGTLTQPTGDLRSDVALEVNGAALPAGFGQEAAYGPAQPLVVVGDDELDAPQAPLGELLQEFRPVRLRLLGSDHETQRLAMTVRPHGVGQQGTHVLDHARPAGVQESGIQAQVRVGSLDGRTMQRLHGFIQALGYPAHRGASHTLTRQRSGHRSHLPSRDPLT
jgi:hypothetical protein